MARQLDPLPTGVEGLPVGSGVVGRPEHSAVRSILVVVVMGEVGEPRRLLDRVGDVEPSAVSPAVSLALLGPVGVGVES